MGVVRTAFSVAGVAALVGGLLKMLEVAAIADFDYFLPLWAMGGGTFSSFQSIVGFMLIFRMSQAYERYADATHLLRQMHVGLFTCLGYATSFQKLPEVKAEDCQRFSRLLVALFSMLSAVSHHSLEQGSADVTEQRLKQLEVVGAECLSDAAITALDQEPLKVGLVFHWIRCVLVKASTDLFNVPAVLLSYLFTLMEVEMQVYEDCLKIAQVHTPGPYTVTFKLLLVVHLVLTPVNVCAATDHPAMVFICTFACIFTFWAVFLLSEQMEDPFGEDEFDLDVVAMQRWANALLQLLSTPAADLPPKQMYQRRQWEAAPCPVMLGKILKNGKTGRGPHNSEQFIDDSDRELSLSAENVDPNSSRRLLGSCLY